MGDTILTLKNISYSYHSLNGEIKALDNISFSVQAGEFLAIVGPSGCGNAMVLFWTLWKPLPPEFIQKADTAGKTDKNIPVLIRHRGVQVNMSHFSIP